MLSNYLTTNVVTEFSIAMDIVMILHKRAGYSLKISFYTGVLGYKEYVYKHYKHGKTPLYDGKTERGIDVRSRLIECFFKSRQQYEALVLGKGPIKEGYLDPPSKEEFLAMAKIANEYAVKAQAEELRRQEEKLRRLKEKIRKKK